MLFLGVILWAEVICVRLKNHPALWESNTCVKKAGKSWKNVFLMQIQCFVLKRKRFNTTLIQQKIKKCKNIRIPFKKLTGIRDFPGYSDFSRELSGLNGGFCFFETVFCHCLELAKTSDFPKFQVFCLKWIFFDWFLRNHEACEVFKKVKILDFHDFWVRF